MGSQRPMEGTARLRAEVFAANTVQTVQAVLARLHPLPDEELRAVMYGHPKLRAVRALEAWPALLEAQSIVLYVYTLKRLKLTVEELLQTKLLSAVHSLPDQTMLTAEGAAVQQLLRQWNSLVEQLRR